MYINDITTSLQKAKIIKYPDDTVIFFADKDIKVIEEVPTNEFTSLTNWLKNNGLIINTKSGKTEVMLFGTSNLLRKLPKPPLEIKHNFETLNYISTYKYLGKILNETLNMSDHTRASLKRVTSRINLLKKIRNLIDSSTADKNRTE